MRFKFSLLLVNDLTAPLTLEEKVEVDARSVYVGNVSTSTIFLTLCSLYNLKL